MAREHVGQQQVVPQLVGRVGRDVAPPSGRAGAGRRRRACGGGGGRSRGRGGGRCGVARPPSCRGLASPASTSCLRTSRSRPSPVSGRPSPPSCARPSRPSPPSAFAAFLRSAFVAFLRSAFVRSAFAAFALGLRRLRGLPAPPLAAASARPSPPSSVLPSRASVPRRPVPSRRARPRRRRSNPSGRWRGAGDRPFVARAAATDAPAGTAWPSAPVGSSARRRVAVGFRGLDPMVDLLEGWSGERSRG